MKLVISLLFFAFSGSALAQANTKEAQCKREAGDPGNPTYEVVFKRCMAGPAAAAPAAKAAAPAAAGKPMTEAQCRQMAGDPGNPTYEAVLKRCLATRR
jgi:hypothetical protein